MPSLSLSRFALAAEAVPRGPPCLELPHPRGASPPRIFATWPRIWQPIRWPMSLCATPAMTTETSSRTPTYSAAVWPIWERRRRIASGRCQRGRERTWGGGLVFAVGPVPGPVAGARRVLAWASDEASAACLRRAPGCVRERAHRRRGRDPLHDQPLPGGG